MKPAAIALALACAFGSTAALAVDVPSSSRYDNRIQYVNYNPGDVGVWGAMEPKTNVSPTNAFRCLLPRRP
ncbi:hypothetical protein, partial [Citrobacter portucalensis]|uniref:hypothetical protein n=1 Tax=Citrobacter portucalensis TaxID=1639133 RepID=UPI00196B1F1E